MEEGLGCCFVVKAAQEAHKGKFHNDYKRGHFSEEGKGRHKARGSWTHSQVIITFGQKEEREGRSSTKNERANLRF